MMKSYLILLLFFGTIDMMFAQNDKGMNLDIEISNLNTNMLNDMLRRFAEENRSETKYYSNFFQISGETIKKSETNTEWRYGVWSISKVENRELIPKKASVNDYDSLLVMSAYDFNKTDGVQFSIWFTPKKLKYDIVTDEIVLERYAPVPIFISLRDLKTDYYEMEKGTENLYFEVYIKDEKLNDKELEQAITFLLENISDEFSQAIIINLIKEEVRLSHYMLKKTFKTVSDNMKILICRCKNLDSELIEWCKGVEDEFR